MKALLFFSFVLFALQLPSQPLFDWIKCDGGVGGEETRDIALDNFGNIYATGTAHWPTSISGQPFNGPVGPTFLIKYDASGQFQWIHQLVNMSINGIRAGQNNVYICGAFKDTASLGGISLVSTGDYDAFVIRLTAGGSVDLVLTGTGSGREIASDIDMDSNENLYITGSYGQQSIFGSDTLSGGFGMNMFLIKYDSAGTLLWSSYARQQSNYVTGCGISVSKSGARTYVEAVADGSVGPDSVSFSNSALHYNAPSRYNHLVLAYNATGTIQHVDGYPGGNHHSTVGIDQDVAGNLYWADFCPYSSYTIRKYDPALNMIWHKWVMFGSDSWLTEMKVDDGGNIYTTGRVGGSMILSNDTLSSSGQKHLLFLTKLDSSCSDQWTIATNAMYGTGACVDLNQHGDLAFSGFFGDTLNLQSTTCVDQGMDDFFIAKLLNTNTTGATYLTAESFAAYPNPSNGRFIIQGRLNPEQEFDLRNIYGNLVWKGRLNREIDLSGYTPGVYFLTTAKGGHSPLKIILTN